MFAQATEVRPNSLFSSSSITILVLQHSFPDLYHMQLISLSSTPTQTNSTMNTAKPLNLTTMPTAPLTQSTIDFKHPLLTMHRKLKFWLAYLHEILPPEYKIFYIDEDGREWQNGLCTIKRGTTLLPLSIRLGEETVMRGIIPTTATKVRHLAYETLMGEPVAAASSSPPTTTTTTTTHTTPKIVFMAENSLTFHTTSQTLEATNPPSPPAKSKTVFDPLLDVDEVRKFFGEHFRVPKGMTAEEWTEWEKEVGIDDESIARREREWNEWGTVEDYLPVEEWPREWFKEGSFWS